MGVGLEEHMRLYIHTYICLIIGVHTPREGGGEEFWGGKGLGGGRGSRRKRFG